MSKKPQFYKQCELRREIRKDTYQTIVTWLPDRYAVKGKWLKLKNKDGEWEDHWQVYFAGTPRPAKDIEEKSRDHERWRSATDF